MVYILITLFAVHIEWYLVYKERFVHMLSRELKFFA